MRSVRRKTINSAEGLRNVFMGGIDYFVTSIGWQAQNPTALTLAAQNTTNPGASGRQILYFIRAKLFNTFVQHMRNYPGRAILMPPSSSNYTQIFYKSGGGHADYVAYRELPPDAEEYVVDLDEHERRQAGIDS